MTAAEPVRANVCRDFVRKFEPYGLNPKSFFSAYGLAEYTLGRVELRTDTSRASIARRFTGIKSGERSRVRTRPIRRRWSAAGGPLRHRRGQDRQRDAASHARPARREVGEIWIRGRSKCRGYWRRPELSAASLRGAACRASRRMQPRGCEAATWASCTTASSISAAASRTCSSSAASTTTRRILKRWWRRTTATSGRVASPRSPVKARAGETLVVVAEVKNRQSRAGCAARSIGGCCRRLGVAAASFVFIEARTIPKTSSGKIVRHLARERWLEGAAPSRDRQVDVDAPRRRARRRRAAERAGCADSG